ARVRRPVDEEGIVHLADGEAQPFPKRLQGAELATVELIIGIELRVDVAHGGGATKLGEGALPGLTAAGVDPHRAHETPERRRARAGAALLAAGKIKEAAHVLMLGAEGPLYQRRLLLDGEPQHPLDLPAEPGRRAARSPGEQRARIAHVEALEARFA